MYIHGHKHFTETITLKFAVMLLTLLQDIQMTCFNLIILYCKQMVNQICPTELQINYANPFDTEAAFLEFTLSITNDKFTISDFNFKIVNFPFSV